MFELNVCELLSDYQLITSIIDHNHLMKADRLCLRSIYGTTFIKKTVKMNTVLLYICVTFLYQLLGDWNETVFILKIVAISISSNQLWCYFMPKAVTFSKLNPCLILLYFHKPFSFNYLNAVFRITLWC